ncbi:MAG: peptide-methionine (R)-S-oxide reductase MsrB [Planctomycetota bacterium]
MRRIAAVLAVVAVVLLPTGCDSAATAEVNATPTTRPAMSASGHDLTGWDAARANAVAKEKLSPLGYKVTREDGTERAFTSDLLNEKRSGVFACIVCALPLYSSDTKYDSGTGWPSFWREIDEDHVVTKPDFSYGMVRTEVECGRCNSHLGHVFTDGPAPTGLRHCINGVSLTFVPSDIG